MTRRQRSISYGYRLIGRIGNLLRRSLDATEKGIVLRMSKMEYRYITDHMLKLYENPYNDIPFSSVKNMYSIVKRFSDDKTFDPDALVQAVKETKEYQEKGRDLLKGLVN